LLFEQLDTYGFSPINEPFRILSGVLDEDLLERAGFLYDKEGGVLRQHFSTSDAVLLASTLAHAAKCSNYVVEVDNVTTARMLQARLPDLFDAGAFKKEHDNSYARSELCGNPRPDQVSLLESVSALEGVLYKAVYEFVTGTYGVPATIR
jgi:hypothetical protein